MHLYLFTAHSKPTVLDDMIMAGEKTTSSIMRSNYGMAGLTAALLNLDPVAATFLSLSSGQKSQFGFHREVEARSVRQL